MGFPEIPALTDQLKSISADFQYLLPEILLTVFLLLNVLFDLLFKDKFVKRLPVIFLMQTSLLLSICYFQFPGGIAPKTLYSGFLLLDRQAVYFKMMFHLAAFILVAYSFVAPKQKHAFYSTVEFYVILSGMLLGLHVLAMASGLLSAYLGLEMVSIAAYLLATFGFDKKSAEAGIKYLLFGAVVSGIMLYGMSWMYGMTGTLEFSKMTFSPGIAIMIAFFLTLAGVMFKIAAAPFHLWSPDVYEGVPAPLVAFFSIAPKAGGFALLVHFLDALAGKNEALAASLSLFLSVIALVSITIGNFSALWQNNAKRMLAYSSIAHTGFVLIGMLVLSETGTKAAFYYLGVYLFMNFGAFLLVDFLAESVGSEDVNKFKGLGMQVPLLGVIFVLIMIALTGLPPTAGFYAKFFVFSALWESYSLSANSIFLLLFVFGLFNTVISLFYYLKIPYLMFFKKAEHGIAVSSSLGTNIFFCLLVAPLLALFLKPEVLLNYMNYLFK